MSDLVLRNLDRLDRDGDLARNVALVCGRLRTGLLHEGHVERAARLGHPAACAALDWPGLLTPVDLHALGADVAAWGRGALARALSATLARVRAHLDVSPTLAPLAREAEAHLAAAAAGAIAGPVHLTSIQLAIESLEGPIESELGCVPILATAWAASSFRAHAHYSVAHAMSAAAAALVKLEPRRRRAGALLASAVLTVDPAHWRQPGPVLEAARANDPSARTIEVAISQEAPSTLALVAAALLAAAGCAEQAFDAAPRRRAFEAISERAQGRRGARDLLDQAAASLRHARKATPAPKFACSCTRAVPDVRWWLPERCARAPGEERQADRARPRQGGGNRRPGR